MLEPIFCFKISAEAGLAHDVETGENAACYSQIKIDVGSLTKEEYDKIHESVRKMLAEQIGIDLGLIECITQEEYDEMAADDDY